VDALAQARHAADLASQAYCVFYLGWLDLMEGRIAEGWAHLRESTEIANREGEQLAILNCEDLGGHLCSATQRWAEAVTLWAALDAHTQDGGFIDMPQDVDRRQAPLRKARQALGPARTHAAEQRGAAMTLATAAAFLTMLATPEPHAPVRQGQLSPRERELVTLVAQGRTDAQIARQLYISVSTVRSHLDRIRDKTGCRRRADLTRLALQTGLI
jgi:DNA-binding CsgD family transcriptional regulator